MKSNIVRMYEDDKPFYLVTKQVHGHLYKVVSVHTDPDWAQRHMEQLVGKQDPHSVAGLSNVVEYEGKYIVTYWHTSNIYHASAPFEYVEEALELCVNHNK